MYFIAQATEAKSQGTRLERALNRAHHRLRRLLHRGLVRRRVVSALGSQARLHHARHLPDYPGHGAAALGNKISQWVSFSGEETPARVQELRFVV